MIDGLSSPRFVLDVSELACPLPVLKTRKRLKDLPPGELLKVITTDPLAQIDFPHFCAESGDRLINSSQEAGNFIFVIEKI